MKKFFICAIMALVATVFVSCNSCSRKLTPEESLITKTTVAELVKKDLYYHVEGDSIVHVVDSTDLWTYTFSPCDYVFSDSLTYRTLKGKTVKYADRFGDRYCKYVRIFENGQFMAAGYYKFYEKPDTTFQTLQGMKLDGTVDYQILDFKWTEDSVTMGYSTIDKGCACDVVENYVIVK